MKKAPKTTKTAKTAKPKTVAQKTAPKPAAKTAATKTAKTDTPPATDWAARALKIKASREANLKTGMTERQRRAAAKAAREAAATGKPAPKGKQLAKGKPAKGKPAPAAPAAAAPKLSRGALARASKKTQTAEKFKTIGDLVDQAVQTAPPAKAKQAKAVARVVTIAKQITGGMIEPPKTAKTKRGPSTFKELADRQRKREQTASA